MPTCRLLTLAALLLGVSDLPADELPARAVVVSSTLAAYVAPDSSAVAPERLRGGDRVRVIGRDDRAGWLIIEPPAGAFSWVEKSSVQAQGSGSGRVSAATALIRAGVRKALLPGPPGAVLDRGASVTFLDKPPLVVGTGLARVTWLAIAPTPGEVRYVRADGVTMLKDDAPRAREATAAVRPLEAKASYQPGDTIAGLAPDLSAEVEHAAAEHRAVLVRPVEQWHLDGVRMRYESILKRVTDPTAAATLRARLDRVAAHAEAGRAALTFQTILERSRRRDGEVAVIHRRLADLNRPQRRPFVAEGLVQPSSKQVDGHRVLALIGPDGSPVAYLDVPPGLDVGPVISRRAGVRGSVRYNESLGTRLIAVRDLEPLE